MPYRRLPKTDASRLKALEALVDNKVMYTEEGKFVERHLLAQAQRLYGQLSDQVTKFKLTRRTQVRYTKRIVPLQHRAATYLSHFLQVLFLAVERGEVPSKALGRYEVDARQMVVPYLKSADALMERAPIVINAEKSRIKEGGKPILSPSIGAVMTHFDVFRKMYDTQQQYLLRSQKTLEDINLLRPKVDAVISQLWDAIEYHFRLMPDDQRFVECRKYGVIYYFRRNERRF